MIKRYSYVIFMLCVILFWGITQSLAQEYEPPEIPGTVEGTGTYFEITDSEYLNVTLTSSVTVTVRLESVPSLVAINVEAAEVGGTTLMTLGGLAPLTTYYKYEDSYTNGTAITTDESGNYAWVQEVSNPHHVWLQLNSGTKYIIDNATGGDCTTIGTWDWGTKTCTLDTDVYETIEILSNNVILDGNGQTVQAGTHGVYMSHKTGVTIKNINFGKTSVGIQLGWSDNNTLTGNTLNVSGSAGIWLRESNNNTLTGNTVSNNTYGIWLHESDNNTLTGNTVSKGTYGINTLGILIDGSYYNTLTGNTASNNSWGFRFVDSDNNTLTGNTASNNGYGIYIIDSNYNVIYNNNFISNKTQALVMPGNVFNLPAPIGGNYWDDWTTPDSNGDGFVDYPYTFSAGVDYLPWTMQDGWVDDTEGPVTSNVAAAPNPVAAGAYVELIATVNDIGRGGSNIESAEFSLDGGNWIAMSAVDGFDSPTEDVYYDFYAPLSGGVYELCVRGMDVLGYMSESECIFLVVYDPESGFVTGGGWIYSPEGAYTDNLSLTGKANFGFVSKYKKGAMIPTGQTQFQFKVADLNFHSDSYEWLVIAGAKAQYKGVGTINGEGEYKFMLSAIDADLNDNDIFTVDLFKIKIWTEDADGIETVVYDNAMGNDEDTDMTEISGGSIVIHKGK